MFLWLSNRKQPTASWEDNRKTKGGLESSDCLYKREIKHNTESMHHKSHYGR